MVSIILPSKVVLSKRYQFFNFELRSPMTPSIKGLLSATLSKVIFWKKNQIHLGSDWMTCSEQQSCIVYHLSSLQKLCSPAENSYWLL